MFDHIYAERCRKIAKAIIDHYGYRNFHGKKVLDLGAGRGDIAAALARLGASVLCVDIRQENLDHINKHHPYLKTLRVDLDNDFPFNQQFDFVISSGLLCHLKNYEKHLRNICSLSEHIILETEVLDSASIDQRVPIFEDKSMHDLSHHGEGSAVSSLNIQRQLAELGASFKRVDDNKLNIGSYCYDWQEANAGRKFGNRRLWFVRRDRFITQKLEAQNRLAEAERQARLIRATVPPHLQPSATLPMPPEAAAPIGSILNNPLFFQEDVIQLNTNGVIRLFYNYYVDPDPERKKEIDFCLNRNLDNRQLNVVIIESRSNPTYNFLFDKINAITAPEDINIIANSDIFFDETIDLCRGIKPKQLFALTCWDYFHPNNIVFRNLANSQDAWIVRGKVENVNGDFPLGKWACDNRIAFEFKQAGYKVTNPGKIIKSYHYHNSGLRRHSIRDSVPPPHLFVVPHGFKS